MNANKQPLLSLTVDHGDAAGPDDDAAPPVDAVAELARVLLDSGAAACITDRRGELLYANAAYERISDAVALAGLAPIGRPVDAATQDPASPGLPSPKPHTIAVEGVAEQYRISEDVLRDAAGRPIARATVFNPVSNEDVVKAKMADAVERLEDITRLVSDWVWETNRNLILTFVSPRVNDALGYHQMELTGRALTDLLAEPSKLVAVLAAQDGQRPFRDIEVQIAHRDGTTRHVLLSGLPVYGSEDGSFLGYRGTAHDISELKWRQEALHRAKEDAETANRTKSEFLASMSHELRTPLNAIIGFSEVMGSEMLGPIGTEKYKDYTSDISDSARHLLALINDILDAAKIEAGQMSLAEEVIDPRELLESVQRLVAPRAERAQLVFEIHVPGHVPAIRADDTKLKQILINLASNAIKFTPEHGRVELRAETASNGEFLFLVSDTGIGIAAEDIPRAMAPFGQVDSRLSRKFEGTGLGLPLARSLTELHGGVFELASELRVGTTVTVRLPAARIVNR